MRFSKVGWVLIFIFIGLFVSGCSSAPKQVQSGFLGDYTQLVKSEKYENTSIYQKSNFGREQLAHLTEIKLVPFEIWIDVNNTTGINTENLNQLHHYFQTSLKQKLEKNYKIVTDASETTLTIRGAFSGVKLSEPGLSASDFLPIKLIFNAGNSTYLNATNQKELISEVSIEVEFLFGKSRERVFAMTATKRLDITVNDDENVEAVHKVLDVWIDNFVKALSEIRER